MRKHIEPLSGQEVFVTAIIERHGRTSETYLLKDVRVRAGEGSGVCLDHAWIPLGAWAQGFRPCDQIEFECIIGPYLKGRDYKVVDFCFYEIRNARIIEYGPTVRMMPDGSIKP